GAAQSRALPGRPRHGPARDAAARAGPGREDRPAPACHAAPAPVAVRRPGEAGRVGFESRALRVDARSPAARRSGWQRAARGGRAAAEAARPLRPLMRRVELVDGADLAEWREAARALLVDAVPPEHVLWQSGAQDDL